jgi:hypothetical protein
VDEDDAPVILLVAPLDQAALLHPIHDPGRARNRDIERLRETAHRQRSVRLENGENVQVNDAQRPAKPRPERPDAVSRLPGRQLVEKLIGHASARLAIRDERR